MASPLIIAHRGASAEAPENTSAAFRRAIALKADGIELDVQLTHDGIPVVFHDRSLRRLTGETGWLTEKNWSELQRLRISRSSEGIPRLVEMLALTRQRLVVQIELKRGATVAPVVSAIKKARASAWVILASFELGLVSEAARLAPTIPRMLISHGRGSPASLVGQLNACDAQGLSVDQRAVRSAGFATYFQSRGFVVWCWTVNDVVTARRLAGYGIDALLSDNPALLKRLV